MIKVLSYIGKHYSYYQVNNQCDYLINDERLPNLKRNGRVIKSQVTTSEILQIYVSQQYRCHMMIEAEWEDLWWKNSPRIFYFFANDFKLNLDEISFLWNEGKLKVIGVKDNPYQEILRWLKLLNYINLDWEWSGREGYSGITDKGEFCAP